MSGRRLVVIARRCPEETVEVRAEVG